MSPLSFDPRNEGYWGDTTSTLDWCEGNYEVTSPLPNHSPLHHSTYHLHTPSTSRLLHPLHCLTSLTF